MLPVQLQSLLHCSQIQALFWQWLKPPAAWYAGLYKHCQLLMPPDAARYGMMTWHL